MVMSRDQNAGWNQSMKIDGISFERVLSVHIFGNNRNESKFLSRINWEQIEVRECLVSFGAESFVFQFAIKKYKY
jgi:hypothetical protein